MPPVKTVRLTPSQLASLGRGAIERPIESLGEVEVSYPNPFMPTPREISVREETFRKNDKAIQERLEKLEIVKEIIRDAGEIASCGIENALKERGLQPRSTTLRNWLRSLKDLGAIEVIERPSEGSRKAAIVKFYRIKESQECTAST